MAIVVEHARHLSQRCAPIFDVAQSERDRQAIESAIFEWKCERIRRDDFSNAFCFRDREHFFGEIGRDDFGTRHGLLHSQRQITRARREIDNTFRIPAGDNLGGAFAPEKVATATQHVIGEIVTARNAAEHGANCFRATFRWTDFEKIQSV